MILEEKEEKQQVERALKVFFAMNGTNLLKICKEKGINYHEKWGRAFRRKYMDTKKVNEIIEMVDPTMEVTKCNDTFVITKKIGK